MPETTEKLYEGDRYKVAEAYDYYAVSVRDMALSGRGGFVDHKPAFGVLDEEDGGYIAFTTDEASADRIVDALNASEETV